MKTKFVVLTICAAVIAGGGWFARAAWRAQRGLVSLDVYRMPLKDALRKVEAQTHRKFSVDPKLDGHITLHVADMPVADVLERIADQAGARLTTVFAAYVSDKSLGALEESLRQNGKADEKTWTKLAPKTPNFEMGGGDGGDVDIKVVGGGPDKLMAGEGGPQRVVIGGPPGGGNGPVMMGPNGEGPGPMPTGARRMMIRQGPNGVTVIQSGDGEVEAWSPTELVVEAAAKSRVGENINAATAEQAVETAKQIKGDWTTYYVLRKSKIPAGLAGLNRQHQMKPGGGGLPNIKADADRAVRDQLDRFVKLTPEQRVQRARERQAGPVRIEKKL